MNQDSNADTEDGPEESGTGRATVLVVDDEPNVAEAYGLWLEDDYDVLTAESGAEALEKLDDSVDVVLLDRRMPGLSGDEVLSEIRERGSDARVAMVTAVDPDFDIVEMPFDAYLTKPVKREGLREVVENLRRLQRYEERVREQFSLAEKRAVLEAEKTELELADSEEYARLTERLADSRDAFEELGEIDEEMFANVMRSFDE